MAQQKNLKIGSTTAIPDQQKKNETFDQKQSDSLGHTM